MSIEFKSAKGHGQMGGAAWFDRHRKTRMRAYHVFSIRRMVCSDGHLWVVILGRHAIALGHTLNKGRRAQPARIRPPVQHCAYCRRALLSEEVEHYGVSCERCEGQLVALSDGQHGLRERYWYYRRYIGCGPFTAAVMAGVGAMWGGA